MRIIVHVLLSSLAVFVAARIPLGLERR